MRLHNNPPGYLVCVSSEVNRFNKVLFTLARLLCLREGMMKKRKKCPRNSIFLQVQKSDQKNISESPGEALWKNTRNCILPSYWQMSQDMVLAGSGR
jgi:hypothetical protein